MKFIHTADLHIDQPFSGIHSDHAEIRELLKTSNQQVLSNIIDQCIENKVDFLLVVGDTFHQPQPSIHTQKMVMDQFERLNQEGIKVVMSFGNHDYYSEQRYWFDWPENVILYTKEEVQTKTIHLKNGDSVAISGFSYENKWINTSKVEEYPKRETGTTYHIGFYHGDTTENYAPFNYQELPVSYEYWALGHIHKSEKIAERPLIVYPGTPQRHTKKESQTKGIALVEIDRSGRKFEWIDVETVKWHKEECHLEEDITKQELLNKVERFLLEKSYEPVLNIVSLHLLASSENTSSLLKEQDEVLAYLQEKLYQASNKQIWLKELSFGQLSSDKLIMGFETTLIDDLSHIYQEKQQFEKVVEDLINQPGISKNLDWSEEDLLEMVTASSQLIKDKMIFKNEEE